MNEVLEDFVYVGGRYHFLLFVGTSLYQIVYPDWVVVCQGNPNGYTRSCVTNESEVLGFMDGLESAGWTCETRRARCRP